MTRRWRKRLAMTVMLLPGLAQGGEPVAQQAEAVTQTFSVKLGGTRVIYNPDTAGATLSVINPQDYPILVQSRVYNADRTSSAPFVVTPPLFRLDGQQQNQLRIVRTDAAITPDRETLYWLCVTGIPPKADDLWGEAVDNRPASKAVTLQFQVRVNNCIRLLLRPSSLKGAPSDSAASVTWSRTGGSLKARNPTPFFISPARLSVGGREIRAAEAIPPQGEQTYTLPAGASGDVTWTVITDYGGESRPLKAPLK